jgi:hypothetical protein
MSWIGGIDMSWEGSPGEESSPGSPALYLEFGSS